MNFYNILFQQQNAEKVPYSKSYFDTLFAQKFSNIKTLTGTLPLTFTTSETKLRSWTIYGADIEHEKTATGKSISFYTDEYKLRDWTIYGNAEGVGERTENLFDKAEYIENYRSGKILGDRGEEISSSVNGYSTALIPCEPQTAYTILGRTSRDTVVNSRVYFFDANRDFITRGNNFNSPSENSVFTFTTPSDCFYITLQVSIAVANEGCETIVIVEGSTSPQTYIPYGYQIPLLVNGTETDIFIGSDPLTEGESVSKTSTGVDIATTDGNNTITTSLYNQPDMSITYNEFTGVGLFVGNMFIIALQVKAGGSTLNVFNITLNKPLRAGETLTNEQTGETIQTVAGVENRLSPSPKAASYGGSFDMKIKYKE